MPGPSKSHQATVKAKPKEAKGKDQEQDKKPKNVEKTKEKTREFETPPEKIRKTGSAPVLSREVQSIEVLGGSAGASGNPEPPKTRRTVETGVPAAAKAAAAKTKVAPKAETPDVADTPKTAKAVQECLQRASTMDSQEFTPKTPTIAAPVEKEAETAPVAAPASEASDQEESSEDEEEEQKNEEVVRKKKEAHARYMRFSRSLTSISSKAFKSHCTKSNEI